MPDPLYCPPIRGKAHRALIVAGANALGLEPAEHQIRAAGVIHAGHRSAIQLPRRAGKTLGVFAYVVGLCKATPGLAVAYTATTGTKATELFRDELLERLQRHDANAGTAVSLAAGRQRVTFANRSRIMILPPKPEAFRGSGIGVVWVDEAQEVEGERAAELMAGILPTLDTVPDWRLILSGTAGRTRDCLLFTNLERAQRGDIPGLIYAAPPGADVNDPAVWQAAHPGLAAGFVTLDTIADRHADPDLGPDMFAREYLGLWPLTSVDRAVNPEQWERLAVPFGARPDRFTLAFDVDPVGASAAICAGWRDPDTGLGYVELLEHGHGSQWLAPRLYELARRYKAPITYDSIGVNLDTATVLARQRPRVRLDPLTYPLALAAVAGIRREIAAGTLRHHAQPELDTAALSAAERRIGDGTGVLWGRTKSTGDITPLIAATWALAAYDRLPARRDLAIVTA